MKSLFRSFERFGLDYILISGQASVLYGAATFSEDIDIWVAPERRNLERLLRALAACRGRVHKLTPPLRLPYLRAGHGFHFKLPTHPLPTYLDVMGTPPRVGSFEESRRRARSMASDWGTLPVVSIEDLVSLKKTRRLSDYEVIANLVRARLAEAPQPKRALLRWAVRNSFRAEDRVALLARLGLRSTVDECRRAIALEIATLQARDAAYWSRRIRELRALRRRGLLIVEGTPVAALLAGRRPLVARGGRRKRPS